MLDRIFQITLIVTTLFLLLILGFAVYVLGFNPELGPIARDVAIAVVSALIVVATIITIVLLLAILYAISLLTRVTRTDLIPKIEELTLKVDGLLGNARGVSDKALDTVTSVSATTSFTAERVAAPIIRVSSVFAGVRAAVNTLARRDAPTDPVAFQDLTKRDGSLDLSKNGPDVSSQPDPQQPAS